ncbi:protein NipSnap-like [Paramacrobiotus metropolitanus]|uniref:protein NipSnap-like n=1 Tax=Paramacrobiotus metropolitanus TaxID=2943436 RepID=UPI002445AF68|nr:protein NipSnap-like [Paramacrobiotus metropolitanus]
MHCINRRVASQSLKAVCTARFASSNPSGRQPNEAASDQSKQERGSQDASREPERPPLPTQSSPSGSQSWLGKLLQGQHRTIETGHESHSRKLAKKGVIYEMQTHNVRPDQRAEYINTYGEFVEAALKNQKVESNLVGSWMVETGGDQDQAIHIWKYNNGYVAFDHTSKALREDKKLQDFQNKLGKSLRSRQNQAMLSFSFWGDPEPSEAKRIYELRTYTLKPGTLIEWGNHWARAIHLRKSREDGVGGFFTQIGPLYVVHHIWAYADLEARKDARDAAWSSPGWDDCVANTVPLIREMNSRIMIGNSFSPLK